MNNGVRFAMAMMAAGLLALPTSAVWAADAAGTRTAAKTDPLKPGRSAGVPIAQQAHTGFALVSGGGAIIAVVLVAATGGSTSSAQPNAQSVPTTTTP